MPMPEIDWSKFTWPVSQTIYCACGAIFRSHAKSVLNKEAGTLTTYSKDPCPACGEHDKARRISSDPERWVIKKE